MGCPIGAALGLHWAALGCIWAAQFGLHLELHWAAQLGLHWAAPRETFHLSEKFSNIAFGGTLPPPISWWTVDRGQGTPFG